MKKFYYICISTIPGDQTLVGFIRTFDNPTILNLLYWQEVHVVSVPKPVIYSTRVALFVDKIFVKGKFWFSELEAKELRHDGWERISDWAEVTVEGLKDKE